MGLSASQTRYLSLTARKSNVEYQGQQINQARTTLANQSSELYTEMMSLKAPVAPSPYQFVIDPAQCPSVNWGFADAWPLDPVKMKDFEIFYAGNQPSFNSFNIPEYVKKTDENGNETFHTVSYTEDGTRQVSAKGCSKDDLKNTTYWYSETGVTSAKEKIQYSAIHTSEAEDCTYKYNANSGLFTVANDSFTEADFPDFIKAYNFASSQYNTYSKPTRTAIYEDEEEADNAKANPDIAKDLADAQKSSPTINTNQAQYDAAMVQYEQDLKDYQEHLELINQKSEEIHESDKKLELQLKQLDTEQEAIQTEYEAVKKVIEKNIENTFKTFG